MSSHCTYRNRYEKLGLPFGIPATPRDSPRSSCEIADWLMGFPLGLKSWFMVYGGVRSLSGWPCY